ncbi:MAG: hypothetical protein JNK78_03100 [Planctomycetes bacterium]|nr:hypothetical protein [Planctomycetota bacterium]
MRCLPLTALLLATLAPSQQTIAPPNGAHGAIVANKDGLVLPTGDFTVAEVIDAVAAFLCRNYLYDPADVERTEPFRLQRPLALDAIGAEEILHALLASRELAAIPLDERRGIHQVIPIGPNTNGTAMALIAAPWRTPDEILRRPGPHELVTTAVDVRFADVQQVAAALRAHFGSIGPWRPGALLAFASSPGILLLHGYRDQIAQVLVLTQRLERTVAPPPDAQLLRRLEALEREVADLRAQIAAKR